MIKRIKSIIAFLTGTMWRVTEGEVSKRRYNSYSLLKIIFLTLQRYIKSRVWIRAAALTYTTLFSIVPILAIIFAIGKGFGFSNVMESLLRKGIAVENSTVDMVMGFIDSYLEHVKSGLFIGIGLVVLLWSIISLTGNIEQSMNAIWQVKKPRSYYRKMTDYFSLFLLLPVFIVCSGGAGIFMSTIYHRLEGLLLLSTFVDITIKVAPYVLSGLVFTGLFIFIPNTKVKFRYAIIPGLLTGFIFQAFQYFYINVQMSVSSYNAIYGSFAAIPMLMLWINISWCICLFGVEMCYVSQNIEQYNFNEEIENVSRRFHDFLCVLIMSFICKRFEQGGKPYTANELSNEGQIPIRLTRQILEEMERDGLLCLVSVDAKAEAQEYMPAIDINKLTIAYLICTIDTTGCEDFKIDRDRKFYREWTALKQAKENYYEKNGNMLLKDL